MANIPTTHPKQDSKEQQLGPYKKFGDISTESPFQHSIFAAVVQYERGIVRERNEQKLRGTVDEYHDV